MDQFGSEWIMVRIDILKYSTRYTGLNTRTVNKVCSKRRIVESSNCRIIVDEIFDETMIFIFSRNNFSDSKLQIYLRVYIKIESPKGFIFLSFVVDDDDDDVVVVVVVVEKSVLFENPAIY